MAGSAQATVTRAVFANNGRTPLAWEVQDGALPVDGWYTVAPSLGVLDPGATQALEFTFHCDPEADSDRQHTLRPSSRRLGPATHAVARQQASRTGNARGGQAADV